jgi:hypothetical protein
MYWSVFAELCIRTYITGVRTVYWIPWIQFHSGYVRLIWLLLMYSLRTGLLGYSSTVVTSGGFGYCCVLDYLDTVPQWLCQAGLFLLMYSLRAGLFGYSSTMVTSGWFGYCLCTHCVLDYLDTVPQWLLQASLVTADVLTAYWIVWIHFHGGYIRLVWLLLMYSLCTGLFG